MRNTNNQYGFAVTHTLLVSGVIIGVVLIAAFVSQQAAISKQKKIYDEAEQQITAFVNEAAKLAPSTKEIKKYCSYSSAKFEKGSLSCTIRGTVTYQEPSPEQLKVIEQRQGSVIRKPWVYGYDNSKNLLPKYSHKVLRVLVYSYQGLECGVTYQYKPNDASFIMVDFTKPEVVYDCSGSAKKEYY
ncbi:hypothetical protein KBD87_04890 [Candidatus Saccharibacteria bacterium]|nr:hypothetical protein [Candidatus Saccharibacteria bacterium]